MSTLTINAVIILSSCKGRTTKIPLLVIPTRSAGRTRWKLLSESQAKNDELNQLINETLSVSGSMLTKLFTREDSEYEKFVKINKEVTIVNVDKYEDLEKVKEVFGL